MKQVPVLSTSGSNLAGPSVIPTPAARDQPSRSRALALSGGVSGLIGSPVRALPTPGPEARRNPAFGLVPVKVDLTKVDLTTRYDYTIT